MQQIFKVKFNHIISPDIFILLKEDNLVIQGKVQVDIDKMLGNFVIGLGLKNMLDKLVEKNVNSQGYFLNIKGIATAKLSLKSSKLNVIAEYLPSKEWWAKPVALIVLGKFLDDFASNIDSCGIKPGFRKNVKLAMQDLRRSNSALLELKDLFDNQSFVFEKQEYFIKNFEFTEIKTSSINGIFSIDFEGQSFYTITKY